MSFKTLIFISLLILSCLSAKFRSEKKSKALCTSTFYIINASSGKTLDLASFTVCGQWTQLAAILDRKFSSWCYINNHIQFNQQNCGLSLYGDLNNLAGLFPQAMMNWNNLLWNIVPLGDGLNKIVSQSSVNKGYVLGEKCGGDLELVAFDSTILNQKWIITPNKN